MQKSNKQEMELRLVFAADWIVQVYSPTVLTILVIKEYGLSRI